MHVLGVDFDPQVILAWRQAGIISQYGDAEDPEFPATLPLQHAQWVVSAIPHRDVTLALVQALQSHGFTGKIAATAYDALTAERVRQAGVDVVLLPFLDAAQQAAAILAAACQR